MKNILICDDVKKEANALIAAFAELGFEAHTSVFTCPNKAFNYMQSGAHVDVCFLDIVMPEMSGISLAEKLRANKFGGEIVFLTTSNNYAQQSYSVKAFDYLLKPITCENVKNIINALQNFWAKIDKNGLFVKTHRSIQFIAFCDISYVEADDHYMNISLQDGSIVEAHTTFNEMAEQLLSDSRFIKCHRSYILNLNEITNIKKDDVIMRGGKKVPISRGFSHVKDRMVKWTFQQNPNY